MVRIEYTDSGSTQHKEPPLNRGLRDDDWVSDASVQGFFRRVRLRQKEEELKKW